MARAVYILRLSLVLGLALAYLLLPIVALAITAPNTPSDLTASATSATQVSLAWQDNSDDESGFKIERKEGTGSFILLDSVAANEESYDDIGLTANTLYTYRIVAYNSGGNSGYSNTASAVPFIPTQYELFTAGDDTAAEAYGDNWLAQTFTTDDTTPHTISKVILKLYREGTPGTAYAIIRETDTSLPHDGNYAVGSIDGDDCTTDTAGDWYTFNLSPEVNLKLDTEYSIVLAGGTGATASIHWRYDSGSGYADGQYCASIDAGDTWTATAANDFMFEVWGRPSLEIMDVKVFSSVINNGDWLFCILYNCAVPPAYPAQNVTKYFNLYLWDSDAGTPVGQTKLSAWGYRPAALYLSADTASDLTWGSGYYSINIEGNADNWDTPPTVEYFMEPTDWVGADLFKLDNWVRETAQLIEAYYGVDIYTETVGDTTLPESEGVLTPTGSEIFLQGIPGLDAVRPYLFQATVNEPEITNPEANPVYEEEVTWEEQVGPEIAGLFNTIGGLVNLDGRVFGGAMVFLVFVGFVGIGVATKGVPSIIAVACALPIALGAWYFRLWPIQIAAALSIIVAMIMAWLFWLRST